MGCSILFLTGCVRRSVVDDEVVYDYGFLFLFLCISLIAVGLPVGFKLRENWPKIGWSLLVIGGMTLLMGLPTYFIEKFVITETGFVQRTSVFGKQSCRAEFDEIGNVKVRPYQGQKIFGTRSTEYEVTIFKKVGGSFKLILNDEISLEAADELFVKMRQRGIPLVISNR